MNDLEYRQQVLDRDIAWMRAGQNMPDAQRQQHMADFYRFFSEHDHRRGTDFLATFPDMRAWWQECQYHARQS